MGISSGAPSVDFSTRDSRKVVINIVIMEEH